MKTALTRRIGQLQNWAIAYQSISDTFAHLLIGAFLGLPVYLISIRFMLVFYVGLFFELPLGAVADIIGRKRMIIAGFSLTALSNVFLFITLYIHGSHNLLLLYIIINAISATMGKMATDAPFQSYLQDIIDQSINTAQPKHLISRLKTLPVSQRYGCSIPTVLMLISATSFILLIHFKHPIYTTLIPLIIFLILLGYIFHLQKYQFRISKTANAITSRQSYIDVLKHIGQSPHKSRIVCLLLCLILTSVMIINVHIYLLVSLIRHYKSPHHDILHLIVFVLLISLTSFSYTIRGFINSKITKRLPVNTSIYLSLLLVLLLSLFGLVAYDINKSLMFEWLIFVLLFRPFIDLSRNLFETTLFTLIPYELRATILSLCLFIATFVMIAATSYFSYRHHLPSPNEIVLIIITLTPVIGILYFLAMTRLKE
ncbi:hypothetical protein [Facilibium subflavum]|uniref:hypothetical protein n=1 Tax=Facilibium subflavum TaxID=2219058 RepID=UPI000E652435|nr:hypothetical protein [Facilibium subflavum]